MATNPRTPREINEETITEGSYKRRPRIWDGLTITLAIAIVLLGMVILLLPRNQNPAPVPANAPHAPQSQMV